MGATKQIEPTMQNIAGKTLTQYINSSLEGKRKTGEVPTTPIALFGQVGQEMDQGTLDILSKLAEEKGMRVLHNHEASEISPDAIDPEKDIVLIDIKDTSFPLHDILKAIKPHSPQDSIQSQLTARFQNGMKAAHMVIQIDSDDPEVIDQLTRIQGIFPEATVISAAEMHASQEDAYLAKLSKTSIPSIRFAWDVEDFKNKMKKDYPLACEAGILLPLEVNPNLLSEEPKNNLGGFPTPRSWRKMIGDANRLMRGRRGTTLNDIPHLSRLARSYLGTSAAHMYTLPQQTLTSMARYPEMPIKPDLDTFLNYMNKQYPKVADTGLFGHLRDNPEDFSNLNLSSSAIGLSTPRSWGYLISEVNKRLQQEGGAEDRFNGFESIAKSLVGQESAKKVLSVFGVSPTPPKHKIDVANFFQSLGVDPKVVEAERLKNQKPSA